MSDKASPSHKSIHHALFQVQWEMGPVFKTSENPYFRSKYASLETVIDTIVDPLRSNGCFFFQELQVRDGKPVLRTVIHHVASGTEVCSEAPVVSKDPDDPQAFGGAVTYMRRYSLITLLGIAPEDDDGNEAARPRSREGYRDYGPAPDDHTGRGDDMDFASTRGRRMGNNEPPPSDDGYQSSREFAARQQERLPADRPTAPQGGSGFNRGGSGGGGNRGAVQFCTPRQVQFIETLWAEKDISEHEGLSELAEMYGVNYPAELAKTDASKYIERLQSRQTAR